MFLSHNDSKISPKAKDLVEFEKEGKMSKANELFMRQLGNFIISEKNLEMIEKIGEGITNCVCVLGTLPVAKYPGCRLQLDWKYHTLFRHVTVSLT